MSGFDFDALRDPEAPIPGDRERDGVQARARHLRARQLRNRATIGTTALVIVAGAVLGIVALQRQNGPEIAVPGVSTSLPTPTTPAHPAVADRFVPPTTLENGKVVLPVTLPDGATFTVRYPPNMRIAQLGFSGLINVEWPGTGNCCGTSPLFSYTTIAKVYGDAKPVAVYSGADGEDVGLYDIPFHGAIPQGPTATRELAFQFGPWLVRVDASEPDPKTFWPMPMSEQHLAVWARSLSGTVDSRGYLLLHARAPLSVGNRFSGGFGSDTSQPNYSASNNLSFDSHLVCGHTPSAVSMDPIPTPFLSGTHGQRNVQWCVGKVLHVHATGSANFVTAALHDVEVSPLQSPTISPSEPTTTTTEPRVTSSDSAESSSWASPQHGWVLEKSGRIDETTDGGATWHAIGLIPNGESNTNIRFADATHGFAFHSTGGAGTKPIYATSDGGAHWSRLATPFTDVFALAVSNGTVYAVAMEEPGAHFRIWSSPVDSLSWTEDPLSIAPGAGPVPSVQLALSGAAGWLIENDRVLVAGAQLTPGGRWIAWKELCPGYAQITASTAHDLVASCEEGVWTGPRITHGIYFSHDAGATFERHDAPIAGPIASPGADTAVVAGNGEIERTTDGGLTWQKVHDALPNVYGASDLGFTTSKQGFVIFDNGTMLMTFDSGATWQKVMGP